MTQQKPIVRCCCETHVWNHMAGFDWNITGALNKAPNIKHVLTQNPTKIVKHYTSDDLYALKILYSDHCSFWQKLYKLKEISQNTEMHDYINTLCINNKMNIALFWHIMYPRSLDKILCLGSGLVWSPLWAASSPSCNLRHLFPLQYGLCGAVMLLCHVMLCYVIKWKLNMNFKCFTFQCGWFYLTMLTRLYKTA